MAGCKCNCDCGSDNSSTGSKCVTNDAPSSVYACAGASNVGIISMDLTIALHKANRYKMGCSVCVGAGDCNCTENDNQVNHRHLLIDGCKTGCLKKMFENKGIKNFNHIVITQMGIAKEPVFDYDKSIIQKLLEKLTERGL